MPLAIPNVAMDWATMAAEGAVGTAEGAVAKAADVAQAVNPAVDGSPAQEAGNAVVEVRGGTHLPCLCSVFSFCSHSPGCDDTAQSCASQAFASLLGAALLAAVPTVLHEHR